MRRYGAYYYILFLAMRYIFFFFWFPTVSPNPTGQRLIRRGTELHLRVCRWPMGCCMHKAGFEPPTLT
ncbi:uncharacterized protein DS421_20g684300 [Arachis hypogaea]|nr:uncharacterized protein DS421_20g684300 [Arachis hypogaea]